VIQCRRIVLRGLNFDERGGTMVGVEARGFDSPDETRTPEKTRIEVVRVGGTTAARFTFQPGWRWSECVKPVAGTDSCQARHVGVVQEGRLAVRHEDGSEVELTPGDAYVIEPGHDAWVVGDDQFVGFEFESRSAEEYANLARS
jgi:quercetin dioxygenase-like cupin family protein